MRRFMPKDPMQPVTYGPLINRPLAAMPRDCSWCGRPFEITEGGAHVCIECDRGTPKSKESA